MTDSSTRPWLNLYRSVPPTIHPAARTALDMFRATLAKHPAAPIVHYFDQTLTAAGIESASDALACALSERDIRHGDRIAMYLQNVPQVMIAVLAA
jgi:long-chain acyl-CoA synthetase